MLGGYVVPVNRFGQKTARRGVFELRHTTRVLLLSASTDHTFIDARRRTTWSYLTGRGRKVDMELENRRRLLTDRERPCPAARSSMWTALLVHDPIPTSEVRTAAGTIGRGTGDSAIRRRRPHHRLH